MSEVKPPPEADASDVEQDQYLVFTCAAQEFGIQGTRIQEISAPLPVTKIPGAPDYLDGIANLRGRLASVIDFRKKFGFEPRCADEDTRVVLAEYQGAPIGLTVDSVEEVMRIPDDGVHQLPETIAAPLSRELIKGMGLLGERLIILLDIDKVLSGTPAAEESQVAPDDRNRTPAGEPPSPQSKRPAAAAKGTR